MKISHHLSDETLQDYSAGSMDASMEVVIACHLTYCNSCRSRAEKLDAMASAMFEDAAPVAVNITPAELLMRAGNKAEPKPAAPEVSGVPRPLARLLPAPIESLEWKRLAPGIKQYNLTDKHRKHGAFKLLHLAPGVVLSQHSHHDKELTLVLKGSYQDEIGRFKAGDVADLGDDVVHQPVVDTHEPCIALIATQSPVRFSGVFGKIMQPFVGI